MRRIAAARFTLALTVVMTPLACFSPPGVSTDAATDAPPTSSTTVTATTVAPETSTPTTSEPGTTTSATSSPTADPTSDPLTTTTITGDPTTDTTAVDPATSTPDTTDASSSTTDPGPNCGNGTIEVPEECDDGNDIVTDACPTNCLNATCGDGFVQANVEACDDGNLVNTDACLIGCTVNPCGNMTLDGDEQCDDGNYVDGDGCSAVCTRDAAFVFITDDAFFGNQNGNGFGYAAALCNIEKVTLEMKLPGAQGLLTFAPWMSTGVKSPAIDFEPSTKPYIRPDGALIANDFTDLTDGNIAATIHITSSLVALPLNGDPCDAGNLAWTGTTPAGTVLAERCNDWAMTNVNGVVGSGRALDGNWSNCGAKSCIGSNRVFCFEQLM